MKRLPIVVAVLALLGGAVVPASSADDPMPVYYVALGDSLAAGAQPAPSGETAALRASNGTNRGYVDVLFERLRARTPGLRLENLACGGESTDTMIDGIEGLDTRCGFGKGSQLAEAVSFLERHAGSVTLVTIDIGGNDVISGGGVPAIARNLPVILGALRQAAGPGVPIVAMNYYDPFVAPVWFATHSIAAVQEEVARTAAFDDFVRAVYRSLGVPVADVSGAFEAQDTTLVGGTPLNVIRVCQLTWMCAVGDIHANDEGYRIIAGAFLDVIP